ncbi:Tbc2 translation factor, chloroplastic [Porphyridium purpureum]|uniref:Tbc2 translation factor, chloroplastic n=1 Tax=Porphyridium purpureum TaxID=35688 RepID=A0A5J4YKD9_PORPP|nr:Tbc2 translation factor, chloroplastic [Porphyridium purpureum]|eukprot:POR4709..scf244_11
MLVMYVGSATWSDGRQLHRVPHVAKCPLRTASRQLAPLRVVRTCVHASGSDAHSSSVPANATDSEAGADMSATASARVALFRLEDVDDENLLNSDDDLDMDLLMDEVDANIRNAEMRDRAVSPADRRSHADAKEAVLEGALGQADEANAEPQWDRLGPMQGESTSTLDPDTELLLRSLSRVPPNPDEFPAYFEVVEKAVESRGFEVEAGSKLLRQLTTFKRASPDHRRAMQSFMQKSRFWSAWVRRMVPLLPRADPMSLALILNSISHLEIRAPPELMENWYKGATDLRPFEIKPLSMCLLSLAKLGQRPSDEWMATFYREFVRKRAEMSPRALGNTIWALASMRMRPPSFFFDAFDDAFEKNIDRMDAQTLSNAAWAYGTLQQRPSIEFLRAWYSSFSTGYEMMTGNALANSLWGFAKLDIMPSDAFMSRWFERFQTTAFQFSAISLNRALWSFGKLRLQPSDAFLTTWLIEFEKKAPNFLGAHLSQSVWALARLGIRPRQRFVEVWTEQYLRAVQKEGGALSHSTWSNAIWAHAKLMIIPSPNFLKAFYVAYSEQRGRHSWPQLCQVLWSFGKLNIPPREDFLFDWEDDFLPLLEKADGQALSNVIWTFARLDIVPSGRFLRAWMDTFEGSVDRLMGQECANILWAWAKLDIYPGDRACDRWYQQYKLAWKMRDKYPFYPVPAQNLRRFGMEALADGNPNTGEIM